MSKQKRDKIAEANKKLVLATLAGVAIFVAIIASVLFLTPLGDTVKDELSKLNKNIIKGEQTAEVVVKTTSESQTFERRITELLDALTKSGNLTRAGLGIHYITITDEVADAYNLPVKNGAFIPTDDAIIKGMPAEKAGLRAGDIITEIDGTKINAENPLNYLVAKHSINDTVSVTYLRNGKTRLTSIKLAKLTIQQ